MGCVYDVFLKTLICVCAGWPTLLGSGGHCRRQDGGGPKIELCCNHMPGLLVAWYDI